MLKNLKLGEILANIFTTKHNVCAVIGVIGGLVASALGGWDVLLETLVVFMLLDYLTGLIVAAVFHASPKSTNGGMESRASLKGLFRKVGIIVAVIVAVHLDEVVGVDFVRNSVIIAFIVSEGISIGENLGLMGVPYPKWIIKAFDILQERADAEQGTE